MSVPLEILCYARQLRSTQTDAENLLWHLLRNRRFCGFNFRRQHPVKTYILDFYCNDNRLAIELDGGGHNADNLMTYDAVRTKELESVGIKVIRFWNDEVLNDIEPVLESIYVALSP
jgi:very-short-patch-repair endonuclease